MAIKTWACERTHALFKGESPDVVPRALVRRAHRKLLILHAAVCLEDLRTPPGNRLEKLRGSRADQRSIRINDKYRICFVWRGADAYQVEIVDYH
jgi:proteic killer suppression protein